MELWNAFVNLFQTVLFLLWHMYGGNMGLAIITLSAIVRIILLPLTLKLSRRAIAHQLLMKKLEPELQRLRTKYKDNPQRLAQETFALFKRHGTHPIDKRSIMGILIQAPIVLGLFNAIKRGVRVGGRFLWIADISKSDLLLTAVVGILTYISMSVSPNLTAQNKTFYVLLPTIITVFFISRIAAGIGLYWATYSFIGILERIILRYNLRKFPVDGIA